MEIKKKFVETKDKVKNWCEEHKQEIRDFCWYVWGFAVGGIGYYYIGKHDGRIEGLKEGDKILWACFGKEYGKDELTKIKNDNGFFEAICRPEFSEVIFKNCKRVFHEDGSWEFESEVK